jgi:hypothetical protein
LRAPAAVIFFGKQALALYPFVPELAAVAIALDVMLLLALLGVPQALIGISRRRLRPGRVDDAKPESISAASVSEVLADRAGAYTAQSSEAPVAARAQVVRANSEVEATLERLADEIHRPVHPPNQAVEEEAPATPRAGTEPFMPTSPRPVPRRSKSFRREPSLRRSERLRAAAWRRLRHGGGFTEHPDAAWVLVGTAVAIFFGYLISQL